MPPRTRSKPERDPATLLGLIAPLITRWIERLLGDQDPSLSLGQYLALAALERRPAAGTELARRAAVTPAAISQLVAGLEAAGLVERASEGQDGRTHHLRLSPEGHGVLRSTRRRLGKRLGPLVAELPPHEANTLARSLGRIEEMLSATSPPRHRRHRGPPGPAPHRRGPKR